MHVKINNLPPPLIAFYLSIWFQSHFVTTFCFELKHVSNNAWDEDQNMVPLEFPGVIATTHSYKKGFCCTTNTHHHPILSQLHTSLLIPLSCTHTTNWPHSNQKGFNSSNCGWIASWKNRNLLQLRPQRPINVPLLLLPWTTLNYSKKNLIAWQGTTKYPELRFLMWRLAMHPDADWGKVCPVIFPIPMIPFLTIICSSGQGFVIQIPLNQNGSSQDNWAPKTPTG